MDNETLSSLKFQIKSDILDVLRNDIESLKQDLQEMKSNYNLLVGSVPDIVRANVLAIVQDYKYLKSNGCLGCCSRRN
jgi:geranylgeranyl pyrophosphate synthase